MYCFYCNNKVDLLGNQVSFRATCEKCQSDLHVCKNCKHYTPNKRNECAIADIEQVKDKEKRNFCEEFNYRKEGGGNTTPSRKVWEDLF